MDSDWIWTENALYRFYRLRCDQRCDQRSSFLRQNVTSNEQLFHHSNQPISSPNSVRLRSHLIESKKVLSQSTLFGWIRIQSKPNPLPFTLVDSLCGRMHLEILRSQSQGYSQHRPRSVYNATQTFSRLQDAVNSKRRELFLMIDFSI